MSKIWNSREVVLNSASVSVGASVTNEVISKEFTMRHPTHIIVDVECSSVTSSTGITIKIQDSSGNSSSGAEVWNTKATTANVAVTGNGVVSIIMAIENAADQAELPLRPKARIVVTTGVGDAVTVDSVRVSSYE